MSVTSTPVAVAGPALCSVTVNVTGVSALGPVCVGTALFVSDRSAIPSVVVVVEVLVLVDELVEVVVEVLVVVVVVVEVVVVEVVVVVLDVVVVVVNLDPDGVHEDTLWIDLGALLIPWDHPFEAHEELTGATFVWQGPSPYVRLDPAVEPAHVFHLRPIR